MKILIAILQPILNKKMLMQMSVEQLNLLTYLILARQSSLIRKVITSYKILFSLHCGKTHEN
ncbi:hypothetical protein GAE18_18230 [Salmonella enterica]|nr:hypothetical protein [Salmonella enterica]